MRRLMTWGAVRPPPAPEEILAEYHAAEAEREAGSVDDDDEMRDDPAFLGRGAWLAILVGALGIAALILLIYWLLGVL